MSPDVRLRATKGKDVLRQNFAMVTYDVLMDEAYRLLAAESLWICEDVGSACAIRQRLCDHIA